MCFCIVQTLTAEVAEVSDLLYKIPVSGPYIILKSVMINRTGSSARNLLGTLFINVEIGDWKPLQLFRHLKHILESRNFDDSSLRGVLTSIKKAFLRAELTNNADRMFGANNGSKTDFTVRFATSSGSA